MWYSLDKIDKKGKLFNWIVSARGPGKTTACKRRMVERGIKGNRFVYVRRNKVECENRQMKDFFTKIQLLGYYRDLDLRYDHGAMYCGNDVIGYAVPLSTSVNERSMDYINVTDIYFEEFILREDATHHYLKNEVELFLELYTTVSRNTDPRCWFVGNNIETFNPYFLYFNIYPKEEGIKVWKDHAIEFYRNTEFENMVSNTRFGRLISDTNYGDYAIDNQSLLANQSFIKKRPKASRGIFDIVYMGKKYGVYASNKMLVFIDEAPCGKVPVSFTREDNNFGNITYREFKGMWESGYYLSALKKNRIFYSSEKTEQIGRIINRILYFM